MWLESEHRNVRCQGCHHATVEEGLEILWVYLLGRMPDVEHAEVEVRSCTRCHLDHDPRWPEVANSSGHRTHTTPEGLTCTDCHGQQMHFGEPPRDVCLACHEGKDAGAGHEPSHCLACHNFLSQDEPLRPGERACLRCHEKQDRPIRIDPATPMHFVCAGCHEPHAGGRIVSCDDCHRPSEICGLHDLRGHRTCVDCHEPHLWTSRDRHCLACHDGFARHHPEKRCARCHSFESDECRNPPRTL